MSEPVDLPQLDTPPSGGVWAEHDDVELSDAQIAEGNRMGASINVDDDDDNGGVA